MKQLGFSTLVAVLVLCTLSSPAHASQSDSNQEFEYPELLVVPRASERLSLEASKESSSRWSNLAPIQISALMTLTAGVSQMSDPDPIKDPLGRSGMAGAAVGGAWLLTTVALEAFYEPYGSAERELESMPAKTPRQQLIRERSAEESLHAAARLGWRLKWLSVLSNLGTNIYMLSQSRGSSFSQVTDGAALAFALTPLLFPPRWQEVAREQESYKKRIYAPIASATVFREPVTGGIAPGAVLRLSF